MIVLEPRTGAIAVNELGMLGLITSDEQQEIVYECGNAIGYIGIHLTNKTSENVSIGDIWSSRNPRVLFYTHNIDNLYGTVSMMIARYSVQARFYADKDNLGESYVIESDNSGNDTKLEIGSKISIVPIYKLNKGDHHG